MIEDEKLEAPDVAPIEEENDEAFDVAPIEEENDEAKEKEPKSKAGRPPKAKRFNVVTKFGRIKFAFFNDRRIKESGVKLSVEEKDLSKDWMEPADKEAEKAFKRKFG